jgi:uncharacterized membrane protein HdeD (DUF308 family)
MDEPRPATTYASYGVRQLGALAVRGVVAMLFGLVALIWPGLTLTVLIIVYGAYALIDGVFAIVALGSGRAAERTGGCCWPRERWASWSVLSPSSCSALAHSCCCASSLSGPCSADS